MCLSKGFCLQPLPLAGAALFIRLLALQTSSTEALSICPEIKLPPKFSVDHTHAGLNIFKEQLLNLFSGGLSPCRPLIPVSKLTVSEPYENYMSRSYQVTKDILSDCKNTGERHAAEPLQHLEAVVEAGGGELHCLSIADVASCVVFPPLLAGHNVLIVAHASSLEACTRQLQGRSPQSPKDFIQVVRKVCSHSVHLLLLSSGFLSLCACCGWMLS